MLLAKAVTGLLFVGESNLHRPPSGELPFAEGRGDERLYQLTRHVTKCVGIGVGSEVERLARLTVEDGQCARPNIEFADRLTIDSHPQPLSRLQLLVALCSNAVQTAAKVPSKGWVVAAVEL